MPASAGNQNHNIFGKDNTDGTVRVPGGYGGGGDGRKAQQDAGYFRGQAESAQGRQAGSVYGTSLQEFGAQNAASRNQQQNATNMMQSAAMGNAPSQAQLLGQQQSQQAVAAQRSMAASARGPQAMAMAQSNAANSAAGAQSQIAGQAMAQRAAEMAQARDAYGNMTTAARAGDLAQNAQFSSEMQYQAGLQQRERAQNDAYSAQMYGNEVGINTQQQNAELQQYGMELNNQVANRQAATAEAAEDRELVGSVMSSVGGGLAGFMSDERTKHSIQEATPGEVEQLLGSFKGARYRYKEEHADKPGASRGDQFGPASAQAIGRTALGKTMVKAGPDGVLRIDGAGALKALMGAVAHVNAKVEAKRGR